MSTERAMAVGLYLVLLGMLIALFGADMEFVEQYEARVWLQWSYGRVVACVGIAVVGVGSAFLIAAFPGCVQRIAMVVALLLTVACLFLLCGLGSHDRFWWAYAFGPVMLTTLAVLLLLSLGMWRLVLRVGSLKLARGWLLGAKFIIVPALAWAQPIHPFNDAACCLFSLLWGPGTALTLSYSAVILLRTARAARKGTLLSPPVEDETAEEGGETQEPQEDSP